MKRKSPKMRAGKRRSGKATDKAAVTGSSVRAGALFGYHRKTRRMATLAEVLDPDIPTDSLGDLDHSEVVQLVVARLRADKYFIPLFMLGAKGVVDKRRAIREVQKATPIGMHLIEIEKEYMRLQAAGG